MEKIQTNKEDRYIKGELIHTIFSNQQEHFSIAKIKVLDTNESFADNELVIKGYFSELAIGEPYIFQGHFVDHKKFGRQYQVEHYRRFIPDTKEGLIAYLSSDLFHGIGKKLAQRIVEKLGDTAISKILKDGSVLDSIKGLTKEKAENLTRSLQEHQGFEHIVIHLAQYGFGLKMAQKIYATYQEKAIDILENNPYQYVFDIEGFGFMRADEVAKQNNLEMSHPMRLQAGYLYSLQESVQDGHVYLPIDELITRTSHLIQTSRYQISEKELIIQLEALHSSKHVIIDNKLVYLPVLYYAETGFCTQLKRTIEHPVDNEIVESDLLKIVGEIEEEEYLSYGKEQFQAIKQALSKKIMILTGGPGTGKTTVIKGILRAYSHLHDMSLDPRSYDKKSDFPFILTAPTGRAAKRMTESTGLPAVTIHRLLGWDGNDSFEKDEGNQLSGKLLVVDEFSMVDVFLANQLFKAIPNQMQVLLVGDEDQLPSVGPGQVLADLLASDCIPAVKLDEVYRQKEGSKIIQLAHEIKQNQVSMDSLSKASDFNFIGCNEEQVIEVIKQILNKAQSKGLDVKEMQVVAPMYRTQAGIHRLNEEIQQLVNPKTKGRRELKTRDVVFRTGDKVIQLVNQPEDGVFNGDIGEITAIKQEDESEEQEEQVIISFDEKEIAYNRQDLLNIMHAYCISIHKSQGSEFPIVIFPIISSYRRMLKKNLLYTAITRAKQSLLLCGDKGSFIKGVQKVDENSRYTTLTEKLQLLLDGKLVFSEPEQVVTDEDELSPYDFL
ncbi:ATP-dependent RecD-like DNA helicase [Paraliobacillus sp. PM-2]|uniref:SF1B family DNA helicase RecD2 n=1 Tax=Paraliobacillus sp. PM-2 TaxID=1462524 RepID=UPI00061BFFF3|nr:ATP-dependent RecD-like DNA helicase [Paraliobacillus sp. PM-2]CQR46933.1 ATP-dependent RecD-like DNA helicase [Paraliobacillus sp. PM-2]